MSEYPPDWTVVTLGTLFPKIVVGYVGNVNDHYCPANVGIPFYRTLNIRNGYFRNSEYVSVTAEFNNKNKKSQIQNNDILIARVGANLGMVCKVVGVPGLANIANAIIIKTKEVRNSDPDFYTYFLLSPMGKNQIYSGAGGGAQGVFNTKLTLELIVPSPPLPEQRKIAKILQTWDRAIATTEKLIDASKQQKKALMQQLLTGKKRFAGFEGNAKSKELHTWPLQRLKDIGIKVIDGDRGKEYPKSTDFKNSGYCLFLSAKNVTKSGFKFAETIFISEEKHNKLRNGLVGRGCVVLTTRGSVGHFAIFSDDIPFEIMRINSGMAILDASESKVAPEFLYALATSSFMEKQIASAAFGSAQPQLTVNIIKNIELPIPSISEQHKIVKILKNASDEIDKIQTRLNHLKQEKKALMQQLLTGKRRVKIDG